ncbi:MAG TPA: ABC transporter permease [Candidatus Sulfotelmatobacter sp.]|nr:ABC transporter permease [Candidatus Sulfotelmatobacter sp.]
MGTIGQDLWFAWRAFRKNPGFGIAAILSIAIGMGINVAIFSVINGLLLKPLPYQDPERLVILWNRSPGLNITEDWFSTAQYFDIKNGHSGFEQVAIAIGGNENLTGEGKPERVGTIRVSSNLLTMIGAQAKMGRLFLPEEDSLGHPATALLSYGTWARRYGSDPRVLGKTVVLDGKPYEVVGVLPQSFSLPREVLPTLGGAEQSEILVPLALGPEAVSDRDHEDYNFIGKLKRGVSVEQARAEMDTITARLRHDHPDLYPPNGGLTFGIVPLLEQVVGDTRRPLLVLFGAAGFVLLIACANVANLLLSRAVARQQEITLRSVLGAGRSRIVRQLLTECVALAVCGGAVGAALAALGMAAIRWLRPANLPRVQDIHLDWHVLLFAFLLALLSGLLFGLAPALRVSRVDLNATLKSSGRSASEAGAVWGRGRSMRKLLIVSEVALSLVLLVGAGLLLRSFASLQTVSPGFNADQVLTLGLTTAGPRYKDHKQVLETYHRLWEQLDHLPGVTAAGGITSLPLSQMYAWGPITVEGKVLPPGENFINADERMVGGRYFEAMQIPLVSGRLFTEQDSATSPPVVIVDDYMAGQLWPHEDPLGKRIKLGSLTSDEPFVTVVGVVGRVKQYTLDTDSRIALYLPQTQYPVREMNVVVRSPADPAVESASVMQIVRGLDPDLPVYSVRTMRARVAESLARRRFSMMLLVIFAAVSLVLAALGTYAVMAYLVNQGTPEIGIRVALGATRFDILRMIVKRGMQITLAGVGVGLVGAFLLTGLIRSLLFGILPTDPTTYVVVSLFLVTVSFLATYIPARRAAQVDPVTSLRNE